MAKGHDHHHHDARPQPTETATPATLAHGTPSPSRVTKAVRFCCPTDVGAPQTRFALSSGSSNLQSDPAALAPVSRPAAPATTTIAAGARRLWIPAPLSRPLSVLRI